MLYASDNFEGYENQQKTMDIKLIYKQLNVAYVEGNIFQLLAYGRLSINISC